MNDQRKDAMVSVSFWTEVMCSRLEPSRAENRRRYVEVRDALETALADQRKKFIEIVRERMAELEKDARDCVKFSPRMTKSTRARRDEARHLLRALKKVGR